MADTPDLNPKAQAFQPTGGSAANVSKGGAASTATPAPAQASTGEPSQAQPKVRIPRNSELKAQLEASQHEVADYKKRLFESEQQVKRLQYPPPTMMTWLGATLRDKFAYVEELEATSTAQFEHAKAFDRQSQKLRAEVDNERQELDALKQIVDDATQINGIGLNTAVKNLSATAREAMETEVKRLVALCVNDEEAVKKVAAVQVAKFVADQKVKAQYKETSIDTALKQREDRIKQQEEYQRNWYQMVQDFDLMAEEHRRKALADIGAAAPLDERRYALSDPALKAFAEEKRLAGFLECASASDLRRAFQDKVDGLDSNRVAYLADVRNPKNPFQIGIRIGKVFGWRVLCLHFDKTQWDHSLDTHKWTWEQFWTAHIKILPGTIWDGVKRGFAMAQQEFEAREQQEEVQALLKSDFFELPTREQDVRVRTPLNGSPFESMASGSSLRQESQLTPVTRTSRPELLLVGESPEAQPGLASAINNFGDSLYSSLFGSTSGPTLPVPYQSHASNLVDLPNLGWGALEEDGRRSLAWDL